MVNSKTPNLDIMNSFELRNIPTLDVCVLGALELFMQKKLPNMKLPYKHPLVVGSGNAEATGRILFHDTDSVFASESDVKEKLKKINTIDGVVLVSASGSKHAVKIAKLARKHKKHLTLISNTAHAPAEKYLDHKHSYDEYIFPRQREPYTYNCSTYLGMILGKTHEDPKKIYNFIENKLSKLKLPNFKKYDKFYVIVPERFSRVTRMIQIKFTELFGRMVAVNVETVEGIKHATTLVPSNELFISFGDKNVHYGKNKLHIPLPKNADYATMMAVSYFVVGKIQAAKEPYFKKNISKYCREASRVFGTEIGAVVE
jgi:hypothetical protein